MTTTYLKEWHVIVLVAESLDKLVYLSALDGLGGGEGLDVGGPRGGGEEQHQLGGGGGQCAPVSLGHDVAELGREQLTLGQQGVAQGDDGPGQTKYINFVFRKVCNTMTFLPDG